MTQHIRQKPHRRGSLLREDRLADQIVHNMSPQRQQWLGELYDRMIGRLWGHALAIVADRALAEDAVQQAFMKLARRVTNGPIFSPEGYLLIAVRNEAYRLVRSRRRQAEGIRPEDAHELWLRPLPGALLEEELCHQVQQAMEQLPPEQREVVYLKIWEDQTFQQIAEHLEISINTAASRYRYATDKLERLLGPYLESDS
jgi:RNA polymerase sigma-70 factor, ECF subfamily